MLGSSYCKLLYNLVYYFNNPMIACCYQLLLNPH